MPGFYAGVSDGRGVYLLAVFDAHHGLDGLGHNGDLGVYLELALVFGCESNFGLRGFKGRKSV